MNAENKNLTVQIQNTTTPNRKRIVIEYPCEVEQYDITVTRGRLTDVLKVFEAMYEQGVFIHHDGTPIKKGELMMLIGHIFDVDTQYWARMIGNSYEKESGLRVFQQMQEWAKSR